MLVGDPDAVDVVRLDALSLQSAVDLRPRAVEDNGVQADMVQESETGGELLQVVGDDGAADLDDGELLLGDGGEVL